MPGESEEARGGRRKPPRPSGASLFEWALALEQDRDREAEPVGAGR